MSENRPATLIPLWAMGRPLVLMQLWGWAATWRGTTPKHPFSRFSRTMCVSPRLHGSGEAGGSWRKGMREKEARIEKCLLAEKRVFFSGVNTKDENRNTMF